MRHARKQPLHGRSVIIYVRFTRIVSVVSVRQTNKGEGNLILRTIILPWPPLSDTRTGLSRRRQKSLIAPIRRHLPSWLVIILVGIVVLLFFSSLTPPPHTHTHSTRQNAERKVQFAVDIRALFSTVGRDRMVLICHVYFQKP